MSGDGDMIRHGLNRLKPLSRSDAILNLMPTTFDAGVQEFGLDEGITSCSAAIEGRWAIAADVKVRGSSRERARALAGMIGSVLARRGPQLPLIRELDHVTRS